MECLCLKVLVCISFAVFELNDTSMDFSELNILVTQSCSADELFINIIRKCRSLGRNDIRKFSSRLGHHNHCLMWAKMFGKTDFPTQNFVWVSTPCLPLAIQSFPCPLGLLCLPLLHHWDIRFVKSADCTKWTSWVIWIHHNRQTLEMTFPIPPVIIIFSPISPWLPLCPPGTWTPLSGCCLCCTRALPWAGALPSGPHNQDLPSWSGASKSPGDCHCPGHGKAPVCTDSACGACAASGALGLHGLVGWAVEGVQQGDTCCSPCPGQMGSGKLQRLQKDTQTSLRSSKDCQALI